MNPDALVAIRRTLAATDPSSVFDQVPRDGVGLAVVLFVIGLAIGLARKILWLAVVAGVIAAAGAAVWWYTGQHPLP